MKMTRLERPEHTPERSRDAQSLSHSRARGHLRLSALLASVGALCGLCGAGVLPPPAWAQTTSTVAPRPPHSGASQPAAQDVPAGRARRSKRASAAVPAPLEALSEEQLVLARQVRAGEVVCEGNQRLGIVPSTQGRGYFELHMGPRRVTVAPVPTTTGAIRLENRQQGVVWMYLANKSMVMDERRGRRILDNCRDAQQALVEEQLNSSAYRGRSVLQE